MIKKILSGILVYLFFFVSYNCEAQTNNFQCTPQNLGALPAAAPCLGSTGTTYSSTATTASGTTANATNDSLSGAITSCYLGTVPLKDVWYTFIASETHVEITINSVTLKDPYVAIYESSNNECIGLMPSDCRSFTGSGLQTFEFGPLTFGVKYYLQVASTSGVGGTFTLSLRSKNVCSDCLKNSVLQAYPLPVQAAYPADTTINFCYSVIGYKQLFANRLHGVVPVFGNGWDISTLKIISVADSADFKGVWKWFNGVSAGGAKVNGFFYETNNNNNPTDNFGDEGNATTIWTFCFSIKTKKTCTSGQQDLGILFNTYSDGESGSLIVAKNCSGDNDYTFKAHMNCCSKPLAAYPVQTNCRNTSDGKINAWGGSSFQGYTYTLYNSTGIKIDKVKIITPGIGYTKINLKEGNYYLYITDNITGSCTTALNIYVPGPVSYYFQQSGFGCGTGCNASVKTIFINGETFVSKHKWSNGSTSSSPTGLCSGWNYDTITLNTLPIGCKFVDSVFIFNAGSPSPAFKYDKATYCSAESSATVTAFPSTAGGRFTITKPFSGVPININTGTVDISGITSPGFIVVRYDTGPPCSAFATDSFFVNLSPPPVTFGNRNSCVGDTLIPFFNSSASNTINWYSDSALVNLVGTQGPNSYYHPLAGSALLPGTYTYFVFQKNSTSICRSATTKITVRVFSVPPVDAGPNATICPGFGINLAASGASSYVWQPGNFLNSATIANPIATPTVTTSFTVTGTDLATGCKATDTVTIAVSSTGKCNLVIYNGFTPNGDNHNDFWYIDGISTDASNEVSIFNRWGEKLWGTRNYDNLENKWRGQGPTGAILPDGTYFYVIQYKGETLKGWVELTR